MKDRTKDEIKVAIKAFIVFNLFMACAFFWFHAPQILLR